VRIRVIGVGTERGEDAAGLAVAELLAKGALPAGVSVHRCERPLPDLLDALGGADAAIVVDACRTGAPAGSVLRLERVELGRALASSSHALGVAEALALAEALGRAPARIEVIGVEIAEADAPRLAPGAPAGVAEAARAALEIAKEIGGLSAKGSSDA
jgi:hydrogenase maturation protease